MPVANKKGIDLPLAGAGDLTADKELVIFNPVTGQMFKTPISDLGGMVLDLYSEIQAFDADGFYLINQYFLLEKIIVLPGSDIANFQIGSTAGAHDILNMADPISGSEVIDINIFTKLNNSTG